MLFKTCKTCGINKPEIDFQMKLKGRMPHCKPCRKNNEISSSVIAKTKFCRDCKTTKPASDYTIARRNHDGLAPKCRECERAKTRTEEYRAKQRASYRGEGNRWATQQLAGAKIRARRHGVPFSLTKADLVRPETCPVLGIPLTVALKGMSPSAPTLDRVNPALGYVPGNVRVISFRANRIKSDETDPTVFERVAAYMRGEL